MSWIKKGIFYSIMFSPAVYLAYVLVTALLSFHILAQIQQKLTYNSYSVFETPVYELVLDYILRPTYERTRNIYHSISSCVQKDDKLIYVPQDRQVCNFENLEFQTRLEHRSKIRWYTDKKDKRANTFNILVLGDSFAMGWGVNGEQTFSALLEKLDKRIVVDNMAVSSYALPRELMVAQQALERSRYDLILIQYCNNDRGEIQKFARERDLRRKFDIPYDSGQPLDTIEKAFRLELLKTVAKLPFQMIGKVIGRINRKLKSYFGDSEGEKDTAYAHSLAENWSSFLNEDDPPVIVFPVNSHGAKTSVDVNHLRNSLAYTDAAGKITIIDPLSDIPEEARQRLFFILDDHLNEKGHEFLAEHLAPYIKDIMSQSTI